MNLEFDALVLNIGDGTGSAKWGSRHIASSVFLLHLLQIQSATLLMSLTFGSGFIPAFYGTKICTAEEAKAAYQHDM